MSKQWTMVGVIVGGLALIGDKAALKAASAGDVWVLYPLDPLPSRWWHALLWVGLSVAGVAVQLATSTNKSAGVKKAKSK